MSTSSALVKLKTDVGKVKCPGVKWLMRSVDVLLTLYQLCTFCKEKNIILGQQNLKKKKNKQISIGIKHDLYRLEIY